MLVFTLGNLAMFGLVTAVSAYDLLLECTHTAICCSNMLQQFCCLVCSGLKFFAPASNVMILHTDFVNRFMIIITVNNSHFS